VSVKKTGGGMFDPAARPVYFAAGTQRVNEGEKRARFNWPPYVLVAVNDVMTERDEALHLVTHLDEGRSVLLDSGVFALANGHRKANGGSLADALNLAPEQLDGFAELFERYVDLCQRHGDRLWGYIELDQGGAVNKRRTRARLEAAGLVPIPVYHPLNDGWDYFDELACGYDRMCVGNVVHAKSADRVRVLHTLWERHRAYPDLWIHVLGLTPNEYCLAAPPDSCDSSTWLTPLRWPAVRTETAMLHPARDLGPQFTYDLDNPDAPGKDRTDAFNLCAAGVIHLGIAWRHAERRITELSGQPPHPPHLTGERPATPGKGTQ
jgi:hypothetical protein